MNSIEDDSLTHTRPPNTMALVGEVTQGSYSMGVVLRNRKDRWIGHGTLELTALYLLVIGTRSLEPLHRILSFFVLGTVFLPVSLIFTRVKHRQHAQYKENPGQ